MHACTQASAVQQERFFTELRESPDGFAVVAEHFGRGVMNATSAVASSAAVAAVQAVGLTGLADVGL